MFSRRFVLRALCVAAVTSAAACSGQSPVAPAAANGSTLTADATSSRPTGGGGSGGTTPGTYEITFLKEVRGVIGLQPVVDNTLNIGEWLVLTAKVTDASGAPAQNGRITYEYCDVSNVKVQSSECATGRGRWRRLWTMDVDPVGSRFGFGTCSTPRVIGFRLRYSGGSAIADGVSAPKDVTWQ